MNVSKPNIFIYCTYVRSTFDSTHEPRPFLIYVKCIQSDERNKPRPQRPRTVIGSDL